jgi:hypothetical protein
MTLSDFFRDDFASPTRLQFSGYKFGMFLSSAPMALAHRRFILVAREKELSRAERRMLDKLRDLNKEIHTAMPLVEYFHRALDKASVPSFRKAMKAWYLVVRESKLEPFLKLAKMICRYRKQIEAYISSQD